MDCRWYIYFKVQIVWKWIWNCKFATRYNNLHTPSKIYNLMASDWLSGFVFNFVSSQIGEHPQEGLAKFRLIQLIDLNVLQGKESLNGMDWSAGAWIWEPQSWSLGCTVHKFNALSYSAIYSTNCSTIDKICFLCFRLCMLLFYLSTWATIPPFYMQLLGAYNFWLVQLPLPRSDLGNTFDVVFYEWVLHIPWFKVQTISLKLCCWKDSPNFQKHKIETKEKKEKKNPCSALDVKIWMK